MADQEARELRRQKILKNSQNRLDLLLGVKKSLDPLAMQTTTSESIPVATEIDRDEGTQTMEKTRPLSMKTGDVVGTIKHDAHLLNQDPNPEFESPPSPNDHDGHIRCTFNGYSNTEIKIYFLMALFVALIIPSQYSYLTFNNVLLPFLTFQFAHGLAHYKYLPSTSTQFQMFTALLRLSGISHKSLNNLMIIVNFLFILIDNFVLYMFSFICINIVLAAVWVV